MLMIGPNGCTAFVHSDDTGEVYVTISDGLFDIPRGLITEAARHGFVIYEESGAPLAPIASTPEGPPPLPVPRLTVADVSETITAVHLPAVSQPVKRKKRRGH